MNVNPVVDDDLEATRKDSPQDESSSSRTYEHKLRSMSTSELLGELSTLKWHYALFQDKKKHEMANLIETEIARRKEGGSTKQSPNNNPSQPIS
jgi:hypothetical protein